MKFYGNPLWRHLANGKSNSHAFYSQDAQGSDPPIRIKISIKKYFKKILNKRAWQFGWMAIHKNSQPSTHSLIFIFTKSPSDG